jgi:hypothetical protein
MKRRKEGAGLPDRLPSLGTAATFATPRQSKLNAPQRVLLTPIPIVPSSEEHARGQRAVVRNRANDEQQIAALQEELSNAKALNEDLVKQLAIERASVLDYRSANESLKSNGYEAVKLLEAKLGDPKVMIRNLGGLMAAELKACKNKLKEGVGFTVNVANFSKMGRYTHEAFLDEFKENAPVTGRCMYLQYCCSVL